MSESPFRFRSLILPIVLAWLISAGMRWWTFDDRFVPVNAGASHHVLLTVVAYDRTPVATHHMLPIVTLGRPMDRDIKFGAAVRSPDGIYYYLSFPTLGFAAPWGFFKVTGLAPNARNLMLFNFLVHLAATLLLAALAAEMTQAAGLDPTLGRLVVFLSALTYLFAFEARYSHGVVYWHHSLFQPVWIAQLLALCRALRRAERGDAPTEGQRAALIATAALGPMIEWTGYLTSAATAFVLWRRGRARGIAAVMLGVTAIAGVAFVAQYALVVGVTPLIASLAERAGARAGVHVSPLDLLRGYVDSFGWPLLCFVGLVVILRRVALRRDIPKWAIALLLAAALPLVENAILAEHAVEYHFDRLKVLVTCIVLLVACLVVFPRVWLERMLVGWTFVIATMLLEPPRKRLGGTSPPIASNEPFVLRVKAAARPCAVYGTDGYVRGWSELEFNSNMYETVPTADSLYQIARARGACQGIYVKSSLNFGEAMYLWGSATLYDPATGRVDTIPGTARRRPRVPPPEPADH